jgi:hypothetical protein
MKESGKITIWKEKVGMKIKHIIYMKGSLKEGYLMVKVP